MYMDPRSKEILADYAGVHKGVMDSGAAFL
jgi:hypothetical protein